LLEIVNTNPEWRRKLVKALFPEIDLPKALQELIESNRLMRAQLGDVEARLERMEAWQGHTDTRLERMEAWQGHTDTRLGRMERDLAALKGDNYESNFERKADAIFGGILKRGRNSRQEVIAQLDQAEEIGQLSEREYTQVLAADLLWNGRLKQQAINLTLVVEVSWFAEEHDLNRASQRSEILRSVGLSAIGVVAAREWTETMRTEAQQRNLLIVDEYKIDNDSWQAVLQSL